jgi:2-methylcitrate dehydratase PrpD
MPDKSTVTERFAAFVETTDFDDLPADVIASTKQRILDTIGVAWAGSTAPGCGEARQMMLADGVNGACTLWASGKRIVPRAAAFVNGMHAAALDYDSVYERGSVHPDIVTVPAAWALAEDTGADGRALITAVALGNEIACRLGAANLENRGWFYTSLHGVFGAAAASAKLLGLSSDGIANALGLALSHAGGSQQALIEKSLAKRAQSGFAADAGVFVAQLAAAGLNGPREAIEGKFGYHNLYGAGDPSIAVDGLGTHYESLATAIKKYPSCTANHVPIDLLIGIVAENDLSPENIAGVEVEISSFADQLVGAEFDPSDNPQVAAQFSIQYSAASAALRRRLGIAEIQVDAVFDPDVGGFLPKIKTVADTDNPGKFAPATVRVEMTDGKVYDGSLENVPGTLENPLSAEDVATKFRDCVSFGSNPLAAQDAAALAVTLNDIESCADLGTVFSGLHA